MSYRKKSVVLGPTYEEEIELRIKEAHERAGYAYKRKNIKPIVFRDVNAPKPTIKDLPSIEDLQERTPAIIGWAAEGLDRVSVEVAERVAATGETPEAAYQYIVMDAQRHIAQELDQLRETDPAAAALQIEFTRRMFRSQGKEPPYPFN